MSASISLVEDDVFTALKSFLALILPSGVEIVRGQDNRVPEPIDPINSGFVVMTGVSANRIETVSDIYQSINSKQVLAPAEFNIQLDFYGQRSSEWASITQALFRNNFAYENFPTNIKPLYADNPIQMPLINAESQYEERWKLSAFIQYNPIVTVNQDTFATAKITTAEVDSRFKP